MNVHGGCHCGSLRYEAEIDPERVGVCHCTDCQRLTGSAFSVYAPVRRENFRLTGEPRIYVKTAESGNRRAQAFCPSCGTCIYGADAQSPQVYNLRVGTMDERALLPPKMQIWCRSALPWLNALAAVPGVAKEP
jgi:hypothetical protein